jgi:hypothetical protein
VLILGPFQLEPWHLIIIAIGLVFVGWIVRGFMVRVTGTWERVDEGLRPGQTERITLVQFGPFVRGRRMMKGGFQEYNGVLRGRSLYMNRRDHGAEMIKDQGFPMELTAEIDGTVTARLRLTLSADGQAIFGTFTPQKIEFTHRPPAVKARYFLEPSFRRYRLVSRQILDKEPTDDTTDKGGGTGASPPSGRFRRTV